MDGAVPGKHHVARRMAPGETTITYDELPILVWSFAPLTDPSGGRRQTYVIASDAETGRLVEIPLEEVSMDWRLVDNAWVPLYDDGSDEGGEEGPEEPGDES